MGRISMKSSVLALIGVILGLFLMSYLDDGYQSKIDANSDLKQAQADAKSEKRKVEKELRAQEIYAAHMMGLDKEDKK